MKYISKSFNIHNNLRDCLELKLSLVYSEWGYKRPLKCTEMVWILGGYNRAEDRFERDTIKHFLT